MQGDSYKRISESKLKNIDTFYSKKPKFEYENQRNESSIPNSMYNSDQGNCLAIDIPCMKFSSESEQRNNSNLHFDYSLDIGCFIGKKSIENSTKANLLEKHWMPPINYEFPFSVVIKKGK